MLTKRDKSLAFVKHLSKQAELHNQDYAQTLKTGQDKFEQWSDFGAEIYDELYSSFPAEIHETETNQWARNFIQQMKTTDKDDQADFNGFDQLRKQCEGNELWSEVATQSYLNGFLAASQNSEGTLASTEQDEETKGYLERLRTNAQDLSEEDLKQLDQQIENVDKIIKDKQNQHKQFNDSLDNIQVRQQIREAVKGAKQDLKDLKEAINSFSFGDSDHTGGRQQSQIGKKLAPYIQNSKKIKQVLKLLGRLKRSADKEIKNKPKLGTDEIVGVELGNTLERTLPSQLLYLADNELEPIFLKRFMNRELLQYELSEQPPKEHGPMVICLDSSGSMDGDRIAWAMAVTMAFLHVAKKQNRSLQIIHFGSSVLRVDNFNKDDKITVEKVIETIDFFASDGGTNFDEPIHQALKTIETNENYNEADIVFITDGQSSISENNQTEIKKMKNENGLKVFSIIIDSNYESDLNKISNETIHLSDALKDSDKINKVFAAV